MDLLRARTPSLLVGLVLAVAGLAAADIDWTVVLGALREPAAMLLLSLAVGVVARGMRAPPARAASAALLPMLALGVITTGPGGIVATMLLLAGGLAAGGLLPGASGLPAWPRWIAGLGLIAALAGWSLPLPIHHHGAWTLALLGLVAWRRDAMRRDLATLRDEAREGLQAAPWTALAAFAVVAVATLPAWLPMRNADDLALRLVPSMELLALGHGRLDIGTQAWALAPWSTDLLHALASLLAGEVTTGPLNVFWLLATLALIRRLAIALGAGQATAWWAGLLFCSLPMSAGMTGSLQVESATPAILAALALAIAHTGGDRRAMLVLVAVLAGVVLGAKASNALFLAPLGAWWLLRHWRGLPMAWLPAAIALAAFAGGSSYAYATWLAGNPVLPILNGLFLSPWFPPQDFVDATWQTGVTWDAPWRLVTSTSTYFEGRTGAAGLLPLLLLPGALLAAIAPRTRGLALASVVGMALVFQQVQYVRYLHPGMALLVPAVLAALLPAARAPRAMAWAFGLVAVAQLALLPTASWMFTEGALRLQLGQGAEAVERRFVPERLILRRLAPTIGPADRLLFLSSERAQAAALPTHAMAANWHSPRLVEAREGAADASDAWRAMVERAGANLVLTWDATADAGLAAYLRDAGAVRVDAEGAAELYRLPPTRPAPAFQRDADGALTMDLGIDGRAGARHLGSVRAVLSCDRPGEPIAVGWTLHDAQGQRTGEWAWATCGVDGRATTAVAFTRAGPGSRLHLDARPARPASAMTVEGLEVVADVREDFKAEGEQYPRVRRALCRGLCGDDPPTLVLQR